ncbi:MAG: host specificity factor TipJ family phage tail protein [Alphaproteobacteria bacterium]
MSLRLTKQGWVGPFTLNPATSKADSIGIDIVWPSGLFLADSSGNPSNLTTTWEIQLRAINDGGNVIEGPGLASARGRISFSANPAAGNTVTLNGVVWSFVAAAPAGNQTLIGADLEATLSQLKSDLNASVTPTLSVATYSATATDLLIVHDTVGAGGISYTLAASPAKVSHPTLLGGWTGAQGLIHFTGNPVAGKTITLNGIIWSFVAAAPAGNQTLIGANLGATLTQLAIDLNNSLDPALSVATYTVINSDLIITHDTPGLAGQSYTLAATAGTPNGPKLKDGAWSVIGLETFTDNDMTSIRKTYSYFVQEGRFQIRARRTNAKNTNAFAQNALHWAGARAYLTTDIDYSGLTFIEVKARATNNLSQRTSRQFNAIVSRKLPIWDGQNWSEPQATRSIAWALADVCRATYGAKLVQSKYDLNWLKNQDAVWEARGDHFDGIFDSVGTVWEALERIALVGRTKPYEQGGMIRFFRHAPGDIVTAMFTPRNILKDSFSAQYIMPGEDTADAVIGEYFSSETWKPASVTAKLADSLAETPARLTYFGITEKDHAYREAWYRASCNRFARVIITFSVEFEGLLLTYGDLISVTHPLLNVGSGGEIITYDAANGLLTTSEPLVFKAGENHHIALRRRDGSLAGPFSVEAGPTEYTAHLLDAIDPADIAVYTGDQEERTHYAFGTTYAYSKRCRVIGIKIRSRSEVQVIAQVEDDRVHLDPPPLP